MPLKKLHTHFFVNPICSICILGLLFIAHPFKLIAQRHKKHSKTVEQTMRAVAIRPASDKAPYFVVTFTESQRFYKLPADANPAYVDLLRASAKDHSSVIIKRARQESDVILSVSKPK